MASGDFFGSASAPGFNLSDEWNAALGINIDDSYWTPRTADTVPSNALQTMQPIETNTGGGWSDFWKGTLQTVIGYSIAKDAAQSGVARPGQQYGQAAYPAQGGAYAAQRQPGGQVLTLALVGVGIYLLARK